MTTRIILEDLTAKTKNDYYDKEKALKDYEKLTEANKDHNIQLKQYIPYYNCSYVECTTLKRNFDN